MSLGRLFCCLVLYSPVLTTEPVLSEPQLVSDWVRMGEGVCLEAPTSDFLVLL